MTADGLTYNASSPGGWGTLVTVTITHPDTADLDAEIAAAAQGPPITVADLFNVTVTEVLPTLPGALPVAVMTEKFNSVTVVDGPRRVDVVLRGSRLITVSALGTSPTLPADGSHALTATAPADGKTVLEVADYMGDAAKADNKGIYGMRRSDPFTLLCLPPAAPTGQVPPDVWIEALQLCQQCHAFLLDD